MTTHDIRVHLSWRRHPSGRWVLTYDALCRVARALRSDGATYSRIRSTLIPLSDAPSAELAITDLKHDPPPRRRRSPFPKPIVPIQSTLPGGREGLGGPGPKDREPGQ